ncbi:MAG: phosphoribosylaminoimidazolesuccinocarboxamide synthase [Desulfococcaceae bacterium]
MNAVSNTDFPKLKLVKKGKVRDVYDLGEYFLMVATDRISAYDVVMPDPVPGKGKILNQISLFWFDQMKSLAENHVISGNTDDFPPECKPYADILRDRSMLVRKCKLLPIECVVRGYITGSGWESYRKSKSVCGIPLPDGLKESDRLPEPLFTPSTKEEVGIHDINIDFEETARRIGRPLAEKVRELSLAVYKKGVELAAEKGILIADTKFEFGLADGKLILIDEVLTPDSSRFWPRATYKPGGPQMSFDKQYVRDYLVSIKWNKKPPAPSLPEEVIRSTRQKYMEALTLLTGRQYDI